MQIIYNDETVRSITVQDLKEINSQSLSTQNKKARPISFYDARYYKSF